MTDIFLDSVHGGVFMRADPTYAAFSIGEYTYGAPKVLTYDGGAALRIGKFCSIAEGVKILLGGEHGRARLVSTYTFDAFFKKATKLNPTLNTKGNVTIGNDVWIGMDATILSGVTINDGAVIGNKALVTKNVAAYEIVGGVPAKHIRFRFNKEQIALLLKIQWWNWPIEKILQYSNLLQQTSPEALTKTF